MQRVSKPSWKQCTLLVILLSHTVFGSPVAESPLFSHNSVSSDTQSQNVADYSIPTSLDEEDVFGPSVEPRSERKKRMFFDVGKKAKQAKLLTLGAASAKVAKTAGKSILKAVASFGVKALILNFLFAKINQVLDFKNRLVKNLENKNREQNSQVLGNAGTTTAGSNDNTTTENPIDQIPQFNPDKISLQVPDAVFGPGFNLANGVSQVIGRIVQNTALRIARLFDALKPVLSSSSSLKSKKRETDFDLSNLYNSQSTTSNKDAESPVDKTPVKSSFTALTQ